MSIFLKNSNWLVSDGVMKRLNRDIKEISNKSNFDDFINDFNQAEIIYTFLIDYSMISKYKLESFKSLIELILESYSLGILKFKGEKDVAKNYIVKLNELNYLITFNLESY